MPYARRVIKITAMDSPNVRLALEQERLGLEVTGEEVIPGVLSWQLYRQRRLTWDAIRQCVGLDGEFYEGAEIRLYPPEWLNRAGVYAKNVGRYPAKAIGVDTAEGGDNTTWAVTGEKGLIKMVSMKTPNTAVIPSRTIALMNEFSVDPENVIFDQGGGGQEHADRLRASGYDVQTVSFGESVMPDPVMFVKPFDEKIIERRERFTYKNRRAQMYWLLRQRLDPSNPDVEGFAIGVEHQELRRQLNVMPLLWDEEGRFMMLPKRRKYNGAVKQECLEDRLGCSPDESDALVLAVYAMDPGVESMDMSPIYGY